MSEKSIVLSNKKYKKKYLEYVFEYDSPQVFNVVFKYKKKKNIQITIYSNT